MAYLPVEGGEIYYEHYAKAQANYTVVLSHGFGMGARVWDNTVAALVDQGIGVVTYDHRCCGLSSKDFADVSVQALGDDVVLLINSLNLNKVILNGWSLGGAVVVDAAAKLGDRVIGLVSTGGATPRYTQADGFPHGGQVADVEGTVAALRADRVNFLKALYYDGVFVAEVSDEVKNWAYQIALQASSGADASLGALAHIDQQAQLANLNCPSLFLFGADDGVVPAEIGQFAAQCAQYGTYLGIENCGHAPFAEHPQQYHQALLDFIRTVEEAK